MHRMYRLVVMFCEQAAQAPKGTTPANVSSANDATGDDDEEGSETSSDEEEGAVGGDKTQ